MHIGHMWVCVVSADLLHVPAWRNSITHGNQGRPGGGGQMSAEERSNGGLQGKGETTFYSVHFICMLLLLLRKEHFKQGVFHYAIFRKTRLPSTLHPVWEKQKLYSCCCNIWPILMPPQSMATPLSTSLPGKGRWRQHLSCLRLELHTHWLPR